LAEYVVKHFSDEEKFQLECQYPKYEWHKEQHKNFVEQFVILKSNFLDKGASSHLALEIIKFVTN
jgi:hemerythrin-like metal-binding protein